MAANRRFLWISSGVLFVIAVSLYFSTSIGGASPGRGRGDMAVRYSDGVNPIASMLPADQVARVEAASGDVSLDKIIVHDTHGRRLMGALVKIRSAGGSESSVVTTDRDGTASVVFAPGVVEIEASYIGLGIGCKNTVASDGPDEVTVSLRPWATIVARVLDERDGPVAGATIVAAFDGFAAGSSGRPMDVAPAVTGMTGLAQLEVSPDGLYSLAARDLRGGISATVRVAPVAGEVTQVELRLGTPVFGLRGRVLDESGLGLAGARVVVTGPGRTVARPFNAKVKSEADGCYHVLVPGPSNYHVTVTCEGAIGCTEDIAIETDNPLFVRDFVMREAAALTGVVQFLGRPLMGISLEVVPLDSTGRGVDLFRAMDFGLGDGLRMPHTWSIRATTQANGQFTLSSVPPLAGKWRVSIVDVARQGGYMGGLDFDYSPGWRSGDPLVVEAVEIRKTYSLRVSCESGATGVVKRAKMIRGMWSEWEELQRFTGDHDIVVRAQDVGDAYLWRTDSGYGALASGVGLMPLLVSGGVKLEPLPRLEVEIRGEVTRLKSMRVMVVRSDFMQVTAPMHSATEGRIQITEPPGDYVITLLQGANVIDRAAVSLTGSGVGTVVLAGSR